MRFFKEPEWKIAYQGEADYRVGPHVLGEGYPAVSVRYHLCHSLIYLLNDPEQLWRTYIPRIGLVMWKYCPWQRDYYHNFPDPDVSQMFPRLPSGRFTPTWEIEVETQFPELVATSFSIKTLTYFEAEAQEVHGRNAIDRILWQGQAPELTKALWFELIFPALYPTIRSRIAQYLVSKKVEIPSHPEIPDTPYVYDLGQNRWDIRLDRTCNPTKYFNREQGWINSSSRATPFHSRKEADDALAAL